MYPLQPDHVKAIAVIDVLSNNKTVYCTLAIRFGMVNFSRHGSIYVEIKGRSELHYTTTCAGGKLLLEAFFGPATGRNCKGYRNWVHHLPPGSLAAVKSRLRRIESRNSAGRVAA